MPSTKFAVIASITFRIYRMFRICVNEGVGVLGETEALKRGAELPLEWVPSSKIERLALHPRASEGRFAPSGKLSGKLETVDRQVCAELKNVAFGSSPPPLRTDRIVDPGLISAHLFDVDARLARDLLG